MVTPSYPATSASVLDPVHGDYARCAVTAYWRFMPKEERHRTMRAYLGWGTSLDAPAANIRGAASDERWTEERRDALTWSDLEIPAPDPGRLGGVQDLVRAFDGRAKDRQGREKGWPMALLHMLIDPMLSAWVPAWVVEQYER